MMFFYGFLLFAFMVNNCLGGAVDCNGHDQAHKVECTEPLQFNLTSGINVNGTPKVPVLCTMCVIFVDYFAGLLQDNEKTIEEKIAIACDYTCSKIPFITAICKKECPSMMNKALETIVAGINSGKGSTVICSACAMC